MVASNLFTAHGCWKSNRKDVCLGYWCGRSKESKVTRFNFSLDITFYHSFLSLICYPAPNPAPLFQGIAPTAWFPGPLLFWVEVTPRSLSLVVQSKLRCFKTAESFHLKVPQLKSWVDVLLDYLVTILSFLFAQINNVGSQQMCFSH